MFCNYCGNELAGNSLFCPKCGQKQAQQPVNNEIYPGQAQPPVNPTVYPGQVQPPVNQMMYQPQMQQPLNQMMYQPQMYQPQMQQPNPAAHNAAVTSFVLGIAGLIGWMLPIVGFPISIIGLVYGVSALKKGEKSKAIAGIVLSSISLALTAGNSAVGFYMGYHGLFGRR